MIPYKEINPFLRHLAWQGIKGIGGGILAMATLIWFAGWLAMAPIMIFGSWWEGEIPLWGMLIGVGFWMIPTAFLVFEKLNKSWESHLLRKGYTKS